ncbi:hypothetical protein AMJ83_01615 [candidate division WOR_3 bacterium SM23_42]|uniref:Lipoprotein n=1 Tax=candidate division WOR_3 bacterium SM23_42 TaxID=1703779 RepID=A0A0S8FUT9_UNCW3|nr:MAG: hypothetical protein AMJ83_01615 [candidate division WOR_3 bacterium SM23_42]
MNRLVVLLGAGGSIAALIVSCSSRPNTRIGTYDSRAIAIAFGNSNEGMEFVANLHAEMTKARVAKNDSLIQHIEKTAETYQILSHLRAFSVGSVAEILEKHKAEVDLVAKEAGVQAIVSKHELIYMNAGVDTVDITLPLVRIFNASERALKWISDMPKHEPLPMLDVLLIPTEE